MSVIKLTKSGKALLFIDDFGNSFMTSKQWVQNLLDGKNRGPFLLLKRLPDPVSVDRFMRSPVLEFKDDGSVEEHEVVKVVRERPVGSTSLSDDALSAKTLDKRESEKVYNADFVLDV